MKHRNVSQFKTKKMLHTYLGTGDWGEPLGWDKRSERDPGKASNVSATSPSGEAQTYNPSVTQKIRNVLSGTCAEHLGSCWVLDHGWVETPRHEFDPENLAMSLV